MYVEPDAKEAFYILLLDNTGSMETQLPQVLALGKGIVSRLRQRGPISIYNFKSQDSFAVVTAGLDWSQDETTLNNYIDSLSMVKGRTALFDAVEITAAAFPRIDREQIAPEERVLILISDGDDRIERQAPGFSQDQRDLQDRWRHARDEVIKKVKKMGITVYAIGLIQELEAGDLGLMMGDREKAESFLTKLANENRGRVVISRSKKIDPDRLLKKLLGE